MDALAAASQRAEAGACELLAFFRAAFPRTDDERWQSTPWGLVSIRYAFAHADERYLNTLAPSGVAHALVAPSGGAATVVNAGSAGGASFNYSAWPADSAWLADSASPEDSA